MCNIQIPALTAADVELRTAQVRKTQYGYYVNLLVYKDARVDMRVLDSVYGPMNWQRRHEVVNGSLYCTISVWDAEKGQWVSKQDVGTESNTEATKGEASDSFKRAGFCWGIGRELYNAPQIRFKLEDDEVDASRGKPATYAKFRVAEMAYDPEKQEYSVFTVVDKDGRVRFSLGGRAQQQPAQQKKQQEQKKQEKQEQKQQQQPSKLPDMWVREYKGRTCVFLEGKWLYLDTLTKEGLEMVLDGPNKGRYSACRAEAEAMQGAA